MWEHHYGLLGAPNPEVELTRSRVLLMGPFEFVWYLGERVALQYDPTRPPPVPRDPPDSMFSIRSFTDAQVTALIVPTTAADFFLPNGDYNYYLCRIMTHLVRYFSFFFSFFVAPIANDLGMQGEHPAHILPDMYVNVAPTGQPSVYEDVPMREAALCPELVDFRGVVFLSKIFFFCWA